MLTKCKTYAMRLLSRREHSQFELEQKLQFKGYDEEAIDQVLNELKEQGLQSDERFAACYTHSRLERGWGPIRIEYELRNKGVPVEIITKVIYETKDSWAEVAEKVRAKKFGKKQPTSFPEKVKQNKFLSYRGFIMDKFI